MRCYTPIDTKIVGADCWRAFHTETSIRGRHLHPAGLFCLWLAACVQQYVGQTAALHINNRPIIQSCHTNYTALPLRSQHQAPVTLLCVSAVVFTGIKKEKNLTCSLPRQSNPNLLFSTVRLLFSWPDKNREAKRNVLFSYFPFWGCCCNIYSCVSGQKSSKMWDMTPIWYVINSQRNLSLCVFVCVCVCVFRFGRDKE